MTPHGLGSEAVAASPALPLCVDMDGTLLQIDTLHEAALDVLGSDPLAAFRIPGWLGAGKARLKAEIAARWPFVAKDFPVHAGFLDWLRAQHAAGRRLVLCTAADTRVAAAVAARFGLFEDVIASDGQRNLRGAAKAAALVERFGEGGFAYAGNDRTDLAVWRRAGAAVVVGAAPALQAEVAGLLPVEGVFDPPPGRALPLLRAIRPYQWVKNALCFVPLLVSGHWLDGAGWAGAMLAAIAFSLAASAIYLLNDMTDIAADRRHPRKRRRPFAAGELPVLWGALAAPVLLLAALALGFAGGMGIILGAYILCSLGYTFGLKQQPLVDVFLLAALYCLRMLGGGEASGHPVSLWLLGFASFTFLSLALIKRVSELLRVIEQGGSAAPRRGYLAKDVPTLQLMGLGAVFAATILLSLYLQSAAALRVYRSPGLLWLAVPLLLFWQCRLWLATNRGWMHDDPILFAARDRVSWLVFALIGLAVLAARAVHSW